MNFTREPIIETIISAKEGYKLSLKSSKSGNGSDEYLVDAIEVVSFGGTFFYRSQERPKAFFLPASDYEIVEVRETRLILKTPALDKSVKIAGGKVEKQPQEVKKTDNLADAGQQADSKEGDAPKKKERKRTRRSKRSNTSQSSSTEEIEAKQKSVNEKEAFHGKKEQSGEKKTVGDSPKLNTSFSYLLTPPESLISETLQKYKSKEISSPEVSGELAATFTESQEQLSETKLISEEMQRTSPSAGEKNEQAIEDHYTQMDPLKKQPAEAIEGSKEQEGKSSITDRVLEDESGVPKEGKKGEENPAVKEDTLVSEAPKREEKLEDKEEEKNKVESTVSGLKESD